jgi:hypothetical protein
MRKLQGWMFSAGPNLLRELTPKPEVGQPYEVVWRYKGATAHFIDDEIAGLGYFAFTAHFPALEARIHADFDTFDPSEELVADYAEAEARAKQSLHAGLLADCEEHRDAAFELLRRRLADDSAAVRQAAIRGAAYTSDRAWEPQLAQMAADDPSQGVREEAARVAEGLRLHAT